MILLYQMIFLISIVFVVVFYLWIWYNYLVKMGEKEDFYG